MKEEVLNNIRNNRKQFNREFSKLNSEERWNLFFKKWFRDDTWLKKNYVEISNELSKKRPFKKNGFRWYPISQPYKISRQLAYEYELANEKMLKKLEPHRYKDIYSRKEGRLCAYCSIYVKSIKPKRCPTCRRKLFYCTVTED